MTVTRTFVLAFAFFATVNAQAASKAGKAKTTSNSSTEAKAPGGKVNANPVVLIETSLGNVEAELFQDKAPISVANFLKYVDEGFYNGTIFHRVIDGFMVQGGGFTKEMKQKDVHEPIKNEATNGLKNDLGTLAMARTSVVDSATAQFFINVNDNAFLNHKSPTPQGYGYAVFGKVVNGMDVVNKIKTVKTTVKNGMSDVPAETVEIKSIKRK